MNFTVMDKIVNTLKRLLFAYKTSAEHNTGQWYPKIDNLILEFKG